MTFRLLVVVVVQQVYVNIVDFQPNYNQRDLFYLLTVGFRQGCILHDARAPFGPLVKLDVLRF
jgi:hypothetical protein